MAEYLKIPEVAQRLDVSEKTARRMVKGGKLPSVFLGGAYRVSEEDLEKYLEAAKVQPGDGSGKDLASRPESEAAALFRDLANRGDQIASRGRQEGPSRELTSELAEYHDQVARLWRRIGGRNIYGHQSEELDDAITAYHAAEDHIQRMIEQDLFASEEERAEARQFRKTSPQDSSAETRTTDSEIA